jgi:hypothetical protein
VIFGVLSRRLVNLLHAGRYGALAVTRRRLLFLRLELVAVQQGLSAVCTILTTSCLVLLSWSILEAMKMEHALSAPSDGVVETVSAAPGAQVGDGDVLVTLAEE